MAMTMHRCGAERIDQCSMSRATLEATGRRHRVIICPVSPRRTPWSSNVLPKKSSCGIVKSLSEASIKKARNGPSTQPNEATSCVERANATIKAATIKAEELSKHSSYYMLTTDKNH
jgi:hypothetical protein